MEITIHDVDTLELVDQYVDLIAEKTLEQHSYAIDKKAVKDAVWKHSQLHKVQGAPKSLGYRVFKHGTKPVAA